MNIDGGQIGEVVYRYYPIHSDQSDLDGYGMYMNDDGDVACWCEIDDSRGKLYINKSVSGANLQAALENFAAYCKAKFPKTQFDDFENVELFNQ
ncbi:hypothetical protein DC487_11215 [Sphingobacterium corticibacter]|uniref:Uncharacterized protein n=2 Tax=Sphingobacterium corticibacter TaxID=2171749 RepID=A0A2T8HGX5_9SPHI|nr:hypothetical protein DC487_11215 [Sphingobacterium corticibacter]